MSFVTNVLTPILQMMFYVFMAGGTCYFIYRLIKQVMPNLSLTFKYKIFNKPYKEEDVAWCMKAINNGMSDVDVRKFLLVKGKSFKRVREMEYILQNVKKEMKGGED